MTGAPSAGKCGTSNSRTQSVGRVGQKWGRTASYCSIVMSCPNCEEGKITASAPKCSNCGFEVDLSFVAWG